MKKKDVVMVRGSVVYTLDDISGRDEYNTYVSKKDIKTGEFGGSPVVATMEDVIEILELEGYSKKDLR